MQEEAEHKMVLVVEGVAKLTPRLLAKAMKQALRFGKGTVKLGWKGSQLPAKLYKHNLNKERHGKMTVKQLSRQNRGGVMSQIESGRYLQRPVFHRRLRERNLRGVLRRHREPGREHLPVL